MPQEQSAKNEPKIPKSWLFQSADREYCLYKSKGQCRNIPSEPKPYRVVCVRFV